MEKESFQSLAEQSQEQFRKQFDPNSITYHGGCTIPVPLNGERVPKSMQHEYPENYDPNKVQEVIDYGQQFKDLQNFRNMLQQLKKSLSKLGPVLQGFIRHEDIYKSKGDPTNEKHKKIYEQSIGKQKENLKQIQEQLQNYITKLKADTTSTYSETLINELKELLQGSNKQYTTKQTLTDFNFKVKKVSSGVFNQMQKILQQMKQIKKNKKMELEKQKQSKVAAEST